jgi:hypothetical protein
LEEHQSFLKNKRAKNWVPFTLLHIEKWGIHSLEQVCVGVEKENSINVLSRNSTSTSKKFQKKNPNASFYRQTNIFHLLNMVKYENVGTE